MGGSDFGVNDHQLRAGMTAAGRVGGGGDDWS